MVVEDIDPRTERADEKIVKRGVAVVVVVDAQDAQAAVDVKRGHTRPTLKGGNRDARDDVKPRGVVVKHRGIKVQKTLHNFISEGKNQLRRNGVSTRVARVVCIHCPRPRAVFHPLLSRGVGDKIGVVRAVQRQGVGQGLDGEKLRPLEAIGLIGIPQLQESTVGDRIVAKVDIRRRKPQLGDEASPQVGHPREVNLPQKTRAQFIRFEAVLGHRLEDDRDSVRPGGKDVVGGLKPKTNVGIWFGTSPSQQKGASEKKADCRVDACRFPHHEGTKFSKNSFTPRQPQLFPPRWCRRND